MSPGEQFSETRGLLGPEMLGGKASRDSSISWLLKGDIRVQTL